MARDLVTAPQKSPAQGKNFKTEALDADPAMKADEKNRERMIFILFDAIEKGGGGQGQKAA